MPTQLNVIYDVRIKANHVWCAQKNNTTLKGQLWNKTPARCLVHELFRGCCIVMSQLCVNLGFRLHDACTRSYEIRGSSEQILTQGGEETTRNLPLTGDNTSHFLTIINMQNTMELSGWALKSCPWKSGTFENHGA
jgi:hypothetical protein